MLEAKSLCWNLSGWETFNKDKVLTLEEIKQLINEYQDFEIVGDAHLLDKNKVEVDIIQQLEDLSSIIDDVENPHVPIYLKD